MTRWHALDRAVLLANLRRGNSLRVQQRILRRSEHSVDQQLRRLVGTGARPIVNRAR